MRRKSRMPSRVSGNLLVLVLLAGLVLLLLVFLAGLLIVVHGRKYVAFDSVAPPCD